MNRYLALLIAALLALIVTQWGVLCRLRSENETLEMAQKAANRSQSDLEQFLDRAKKQQTEVASLRVEVTALRGEAQKLHQALDHSRRQEGPDRKPSIRSSGNPTEVPLEHNNRALFEFIGEPVNPSLNSDVRYSRDGIISAINTAARHAGVALRHLEVDDSEYPCLLGVICDPQDFARLTDHVRRLEGYELSGSVGGNKEFHVLNITPANAYPKTMREKITRREVLRQQAFYNRLSSENTQ